MSVCGCGGNRGGESTWSLCSSNTPENTGPENQRSTGSCWKTFCNFFKRYKDPSDILNPEQVKKVEEAAQATGGAAVGFLNKWFGETRECKGHTLKVRGSADKHKFKVICTTCQYKVKIHDTRVHQESLCSCLGCCFGEKELEFRNIFEEANKVGNTALSVIDAWLGEQQPRTCPHTPDVYKSRWTPDYKIECPACQYSVIIEDNCKHKKQNQSEVEATRL